MDTEKYISKLFETAGLFDERSVSVKKNMTDLFNPAYKNSVKLLKEYGGLKVGEVGPGRDLSASDVCFDTKTYDFGKEYHNYWNGINKSMFTVASAHRDHMLILVDEQDIFYIFTDPDEQLYRGGSFEETMKKVLLGLNYGRSIEKA